MDRHFSSDRSEPPREARDIEKLTVATVTRNRIEYFLGEMADAASTEEKLAAARRLATSLAPFLTRTGTTLSGVEAMRSELAAEVKGAVDFGLELLKGHRDADDARSLLQALLRTFPSEREALEKEYRNARLWTHRTGLLVTAYSTDPRFEEKLLRDDFEDWPAVQQEPVVHLRIYSAARDALRDLRLREELGLARQEDFASALEEKLRWAWSRSAPLTAELLRRELVREDPTSRLGKAAVRSVFEQLGSGVLPLPMFMETLSETPLGVAIGEMPLISYPPIVGVNARSALNLIPLLEESEGRWGADHDTTRTLGLRLFTWVTTNSTHPSSASIRREAVVRLHAREKASPAAGSTPPLWLELATIYLERHVDRRFVLPMLLDELRRPDAKWRPFAEPLVAETFYHCYEDVLHEIALGPEFRKTMKAVLDAVVRRKQEAGDERAHPLLERLRLDCLLPEKFRAMLHWKISLTNVNEIREQVNDALARLNARSL